MTQHILITGANRGIGLGLVKRFLESGAHVYAASRRPDAAENLLALQQEHSKQLNMIELDVTDVESLNQLAERFKNASLDILINNAGVSLDKGAGFLELRPEIMRQVFDINVVGPVQVTQRLIPALQRSKKPLVAMISSYLGSIADNSSGGSYSYRSSKAALNMICKSLAVDFSWLTAVSLHPGWVQTDMGGKNAPLTVERATHGLYEVLQKLEKKESGGFFSYDGTRLPW